MGSDLVVLPPELFDQYLRIGAVLEPLHRQALITQLAVERLVGSVLPRLAGINVRRIDVRFIDEPSQNRSGDKLGSVVHPEQ